MPGVQQNPNVVAPNSIPQLENLLQSVHELVRFAPSQTRRPYELQPEADAVCLQQLGHRLEPTHVQVEVLLVRQLIREWQQPRRATRRPYGLHLAGEIDQSSYPLLVLGFLAAEIDRQSRRPDTQPELFVEPPSLLDWFTKARINAFKANRFSQWQDIRHRST